MNILPKKNWHVLKRENILKVKEDKAQAKLDDEINQRRSQVTDQQNQLNILRKNAKYTSIMSYNKDPLHLKEVTQNDDYVKEEKEKQEKAEKSIGLLTYLGQSMLKPKEDELWWTKPKTDKSLTDYQKERHENRLKKEDPLALIEMCKEKRKTKSEPLFAIKSAEVSRKLNKQYFIEKSHKKSRKRKRSSSSSSDSESKEKHKKHRKKKSKKSSKHKRRRRSSSLCSEKEKQREKLLEERLKREDIECNKSNKAIERSTRIFSKF